MENMNWIAEYAAFVIMLGLSVVIGLYYGCFSKQNTVSDYLLGGKHMSVFPITMSLVARYIIIILLRTIETPMPT
jgi:Na+/proline symporter